MKPSGNNVESNIKKENSPWISEKWYVSEFNYLDEVRRQMRLPTSVVVADCTLRDGEQQAGVVFSKEDKLAIAIKLDEIGVHQIEAGMPAVSKEDEEAVKAIARQGLRAKVYALARAVKSDVDKVIDCDAWGVQISLPAGRLQLEYKLKWSVERLISTALEITDYAKSHGLWVNLSPYDTTRADPRVLDQYLSAVAKDGHVDRIRLVDTVGCITPTAIRWLVPKIKRIIGTIPLEVHCHNDLGLAVANTLAGVEAGAEAVSTTMNGIGERAGNAPTEEVALALRLLYDMELGFKFEKFFEASQLVQRLSRVPLQQNKAVVGTNLSAYESGIVVDGIIELPFTGEAYLPELVGRTGRIVIGKKSGKTSIEYKLKQMGETATDAQVLAILEAAKNESLKRKGLVTDEVFEQIVAEQLRQGQPTKSSCN